VAIKTNNYKVLHSLVFDYEHHFDIISFDFNLKMNFYIKRSLALEATKKSLFFEISYGNSIEDET